MTLSERLAAVRRNDAAADVSPDPAVETSAPVEAHTPQSELAPLSPHRSWVAPVSVQPAPEAVAAARTTGSRTVPKAAGPTPLAPPRDALASLKDRAGKGLFDRIGARLNDASLSEHQLNALVREELGRVIEEEKVPLSAEERARLLREVGNDVLSYGPLQGLLEDPDVTEIMVNGPDMVYVERDGRLSKTSARFASEDHLRRVIERIVSRVGRRIDESSPMVDARLADGSRVNAVIPPLSFGGSSLTIRKFATDPLEVQDLIEFGTMTAEIAELLEACVTARLNIIVSGGTGTGKTTLLNVLSAFIPDGERIVTIEDAVELQLQQEHVVRLESPAAQHRGQRRNFHPGSGTQRAADAPGSHHGIGDRGLPNAPPVCTGRTPAWRSPGGLNGSAVLGAHTLSEHRSNK